MGKTLIIKGADFSAYAIGNDLNEDSTGGSSGGSTGGSTGGSSGNNYTDLSITWGYILAGNVPRAYSTNDEIPVGAVVGFTNNDLYSTFAFAISTSQPSNPVDGTWDTSYNGAAYNNDDIIVTTPSYYVFIKKLDNSAFTDGDKANLNNYFKIKVKV